MYAPAIDAAHLRATALTIDEREPTPMKKLLQLALVTTTALALAATALPAAAQGPPDKRSQIKFDQRVFTVWEQAGEAVIGVERSKGEDGPVIVSYRTEDGSAVEGEDYLAASGVLTWGDGDGERKTFVVTLLQDDGFEVRETVELKLEILEGDAELHPGKGSAVLKIMDANEDNPGKVDDDSPGRFEFARDEFQALEDDGSARVTVVRHRGSAGEVSVAASTMDDGATAGEDYTATEAILSWGDGESGARSFEVPILQDDVEEGNEGVLLSLADATGGAEIDDGDGVADLLIVDDDGSTEACVEDDDTLCLADDRFRVEVVWRTRDGNSGPGLVEPAGDLSGLVWFFNQDNKEMLVKVLDACAPFDTYWVFFAALTNVDFTVTVTDTVTGVVKEYSNPAGQAAEPVQDTFTFATCGS